jgi:hypothetical protein
MNKLITLLLLLFVTTVYANTKLYTGGEKYEEDKVIALTLTAGGQRIEYVYKETLGQCLKSKRIADREVNGERVVFACEIVKGLLQKDKQAKYGIRLLKIIE